VYLVQCNGLELSNSEPIKWDSSNLVAALGVISPKYFSYHLGRYRSMDEMDKKFCRGSIGRAL
jgi:hypothetical protein